MCGIRKEEVFDVLEDAKKPFVYLSPMERLRQIVNAQALYPHGEKRTESLDQAAEFYDQCLMLPTWEAVSEFAFQYLGKAEVESNEFLRWLIVTLMDVLEEECRQAMYEKKDDISVLLRKVLAVRLNFSSSKGQTLLQVYERAGSKEQFWVILKFLSDHPRCGSELKQSVDYLMEHLDQLEKLEKSA